MSDLPRCAFPGCGHPADSHGDRAVIGCVREVGDDHPWRVMGEIIAARCPCNGYQAVVQSGNEHLQPGPVPDPSTLA